MARTIVILCDIHLEKEDEHVEAIKEETITFGHLKPRIIAVCEECDEKYIEPLRNLVTEFGQIADSTPPLPQQKTQKTQKRKPADDDANYACLVCNPPRPYKYRGSLRSHLSEVHNMTIQQMNIEHGETPADELELKLEADKPKVTRAECDVPGCDSGDDGGPVVYEWPEHTRPAQALGVHKAMKHGIGGSAKKNVRAREKKQQQKVSA